MKEILEMPISKMQFNPKTNNALIRGKIFTLYDLVWTSEGELLKIRNFNEKCLEEVKSSLNAYGLELRNNV